MEGETPGERELSLAARAASYAVLLGLLATVSSGLSSRTGLSLTFLLWLGTILAGTQAVVSVVIGLWRRSRA